MYRLISVKIHTNVHQYYIIFAERVVIFKKKQVKKIFSELNITLKLISIFSVICFLWTCAKNI